MGRSKGSRQRKRKPVEVVEKEPTKVPKIENQVEQTPTAKLDRLSQDSSVLFTHFPEEVWLLVTNNVTDPTDLTNLMRASPVFGNLLLTRKAEFLFPQVWKVLGMKFEKRDDEVYDYDIDEMFPDRDVSRFPFGETPWFSKILTLRLVCKSWCQGVDEFYENLSDNEHNIMKLDREIDVDERDPEDFEYYNTGNKVGEWNQSGEFSTYRKIDQFTEHFDPTHLDSGTPRNPVIGRHIYVSYKNENRASGVFPLLSKYGQHVWFFTLDLEDDFQTRARCYAKLKKMLDLLPNLKILSVSYTRTPRNIPDIYGVRKVNSYPSEMEIRQLERKIASHPLPTLDRLEFLSVQNFPTSIFNTLIAANNHISMLEVQRDDVQDGYDIYTVPMPNLKQLSMMYFSKEEFENLNRPEVNWPLDKLYLSLMRCSCMPWSQIFSLLETKWATTLTNVAVYLPTTTDTTDGSTKVLEDYSSLKLNLPKLQRFKLTTREIFSLDIILPMKDTLQFLEVTVAETRLENGMEGLLRSIEKKQVIQFVGYFKRFEKSNIWNLFPDLKRFQVAHLPIGSFEITYTRKGWESEQNKTKGSTARSQKDNLWVVPTSGLSYGSPYSFNSPPSSSSRCPVQ